VVYGLYGGMQYLFRCYALSAVVAVICGSAVTVCIFGFVVGFLINTAVHGRFRFLWFQILITCTVNSEN